MRVNVVALVAVLSCASLAAQELKPVPKDSVRVSIPGCTKGYVFTVGPRTADEPGTIDLPDGTHLRMNGPKKLMSQVTARRGSMIEITGLMRKGDLPEGIRIGKGVRISPGPSGSVTSTPLGSQVTIDVESFRPIEGGCPSR